MVIILGCSVDTTSGEEPDPIPFDAGYCYAGCAPSDTECDRSINCDYGGECFHIRQQMGEDFYVTASVCAEWDGEDPESIEWVECSTDADCPATSVCLSNYGCAWPTQQ